MMIRGLVVLFIAGMFSTVSAKTYDIVILGGICITPKQSDFRWYGRNIGINADTIAIITYLPIRGRITLDATDKIVAPGFIDVLSDNTHNPIKSYITVEEYKVTDGVTTALQMHGGTDDVMKFADDFADKPHWVNYGVSTNVMTIQRFNPPNRKSNRIRLIRQCLDDGALGVSLSPEYFPEQTQEDIVEYAIIAAEYDVPVFIHTRYSSAERELEGVQEAIDAARLGGSRVHIDHINSTGGTYDMESALAMLQKAQEEELNVTASIYPYTYWATYVQSSRFNQGWEERYNLKGYSDLRVVGTGDTLTKENRKEYGVVVAVPKGTMSREEVLYPALRSEFVMISSDGGIESRQRANNHPRGAGAFATAVRMGLDSGLSLPTIIKKMTLDPANLIGGEMMDRRGRLLEGMIADIVIFDVDQIDGRATVANPNQYSQGINCVIVGGKIAVKEGELVEKNGTLINRQR